MNLSTNKIQLGWSHLAILICTIVVVYVSFSNSAWRKGRVIENDVISYYAYLPATFIYNDLSLDFIHDYPQGHFSDKIWFQETEINKKAIMKPMGASFLYFPFFLLSDYYARITYHGVDGYSIPYRFGIAMSSLFYFVLGLFILQRLLKRYFNEFIVGLTLMAVSIGTNLLTYVTVEPGMTHSYSFFLHACILFFLDKWIHDKRNKHLYYLSFFYGLLVLLRPTEGVIILLFPFYQVCSKESFKKRITFLRESILPILKSGLLAFAVIVPQLCYWKFISDNWYYSPYDDNERFFFNDPQIFNGLLSYRKGWLVYSPIMIFSLLGMFLNIRGKVSLNFPLFLYFFATIYLVFSWWCWWYGGSFGMRAMIGMHAILALPMATFLKFLYSNNKIIFGLIAMIFVSLTSLSIFQNYQYRIGVIHYEAMTKETYWGVFMKDEHYPNYWEELDVPDYETAKMGNRDL